VQLLRTQPGNNTTITLANNVNNDLQDANRLQFQLDQSPNPSLITITLGLVRNNLKGNVATLSLMGQAHVRNQ